MGAIWARLAPLFKPRILRAAALTLLLILELEFILDENYDFRTMLRGAFGLPLYHIFLSFLSFAILIRMFTARPKPFHLRVTTFWPAVLLNLTCFGLVAYFLPQLVALSHAWGRLTFLAMWGLLLGSIVLSWLASVISPQNWLNTLKNQGSWIALALVASLLTPYVAAAANHLWEPMAWVTFMCTQGTLNVLQYQTVAVPEHLILGTSSFLVEIQGGCSGYEGIGLVTVFVSLYLWLRRRDLDFPRCFLLFLLAWAMAWTANIARLVILILLGTHVSRDVAQRGFHSQAGWIAFTGICLILLWLTERNRVFCRTPQVDEPDLEYPAAPFLVPQMAAMFLLMIGLAFSDKIDVFYPLRTLLVAATLVYFGPRLLAHFPRPTYRGVVAGLLVYAIWSALVSGKGGVDPFVILNTGWAWGWLIARVIGASLVVPLTEELAFRGYLMRRLESRNFEEVKWEHVSWKSIALSSLFFGALHQDILAGVLAGFVYGWVATRRGRLTDAVLAHGITNGCLAGQAIVWGHWGHLT